MWDQGFGPRGGELWLEIFIVVAETEGKNIISDGLTMTVKETELQPPGGHF